MTYRNSSSGLSPSFNWTTDTGGVMVGDYDGEIYCPPGWPCTGWNALTREWDPINNVATGTISAGDPNGKKNYCAHQSNMAALEAILPGGSVFIGGDYSPTAVAGELGQEALGDALDAAAKSTSFLLAVRSMAGRSDEHECDLADQGHLRCLGLQYL
jgi:hypothetical protein